MPLQKLNHVLIILCMMFFCALIPEGALAAPALNKTYILKKRQKYTAPENVRDIFAHSTSYLGFSLGKYDVLDDKRALDMRMEYASGTPLWGPFKPLFVAELTEDSSFYGGAGVYIDYMPHKNFYMRPSFTVGVYEEGNGKDLGDGAIFRSQLEMGVQFHSLHRIGIAFSHASNGWQDKDNAGTETLSLYVHFPTNGLFPARNGITRVLGH